MKRGQTISLLTAAFFTVLLEAGCVSGPGAMGSPPSSSFSTPSLETVAVTAPPEAVNPAPPADLFWESVFRTLPPEARAYLERLARAFSTQDEAFLLAQGESQFEADVRPRHDKESYLALLYRIGVYAADSPRTNGESPRLACKAIRGIQYLSWEENGPLLEIKGRLVGKDGKATPCLIMLVWRLREPKIEGLFL